MRSGVPKVETPFAINQRLFGGREWFDDGLQVVIVLSFNSTVRR